MFASLSLQTTCYLPLVANKGQARGTNHLDLYSFVVKAHSSSKGGEMFVFQNNP